MKSWNEVKEDMVVYFSEEHEITDDDGNELGKTKLYQKGQIGNVYKDEIEVHVKGGKFNGEVLYFYLNRDNPSELLTKEEYSLFSLTEEKIWRELKPILESIDALQDKSSDIVTLMELIKRNFNE